MNITNETRARALDCARGIADWLCLVQAPVTDDFPPAGQFPWIVHPEGRQIPAGNWNYAFALMGCSRQARLSGIRATSEPRWSWATT